MSDLLILPGGALRPWSEGLTTEHCIQSIQLVCDVYRYFDSYQLVVMNGLQEFEFSYMTAHYSIVLYNQLK